MPFLNIFLPGEMLFTYTISWQKETWTSMHLYLTYIQHVLGYDAHKMAAEEIATLAKDRCAWRKLVFAYSAAEVWWCDVMWYDDGHIYVPCFNISYEAEKSEYTFYAHTTLPPFLKSLYHSKHPYGNRLFVAQSDTTTSHLNFECQSQVDFLSLPPIVQWLDWQNSKKKKKKKSQKKKPNFLSLSISYLCHHL